MKKEILLIGEQSCLYQELKGSLEQEGFRLCLRTSDSMASRTTKSSLILINLSERNSFDLTSFMALPVLISTPVIILAENDDIQERIKALSIGVDDYLLSNVSRRELLARIHLVISKNTRDKKDIDESDIDLNEISVCMSKREIYKDGQLIELTGIEFELLRLLIVNFGRVIPKSEISEQIFNRPISRFDRSIDMHICSIRKKLSHHCQTERIKTVRGMGYTFLN